MKDTGFGKVVYITAKRGLAAVEEWSMGKFPSGILTVIDRNELEGNGYPHDLTDLFSVGDEVELTAEGQLRRYPESPRCAKIQVLKQSHAAAYAKATGIVLPRFFHFNGEENNLVSAVVNNKEVKVVLPSSALIAPAGTPCYKRFREILAPKTTVVMKVVKSSISRSRFAPFTAISARLADDCERSKFLNETIEAAGDGAQPAKGDVLESTALMRSGDAATQTTWPALKLMDQASAATKMLMDCGSRGDLLDLWARCPELVKHACAD